MKTEKLNDIQKNYAFEYINPKFVLELWQEGEEFARQVIHLYIKSFSNLVNNCYKAITKQDVEGLRFIIHQNKANLIQLEASYLYSLLEKLKKNLEENFPNLENLYQVYNKIEEVIPKMQEELKHFL